MSDERHPDHTTERDRDQPKEWKDVEPPGSAPGGFPLGPPSPSYRWEDNAELHGDETGGQEP